MTAADTDRMVAEAFELERFRREFAQRYNPLQRALTILAAPDAIAEQTRCNNCGCVEVPGQVHTYQSLGSCWLTREDPS